MTEKQYTCLQQKRKGIITTQKLKEQNTPDSPVAIIKAIIQRSCGYKLSNHYDEDRIPQSTMFCVGCRVLIVGVNIKPEWGLYHGSIGTVLDIVYEHKKDHITEDQKKKINRCIFWWTFHSIVVQAFMTAKIQN